MYLKKTTTFLSALLTAATLLGATPSASATEVGVDPIQIGSGPETPEVWAGALEPDYSGPYVVVSEGEITAAGCGVQSCSEVHVLEPSSDGTMKAEASFSVAAEGRAQLKVFGGDWQYDEENEYWYVTYPGTGKYWDSDHVECVITCTINTLSSSDPESIGCTVVQALVVMSFDDAIIKPYPAWTPGTYLSSFAGVSIGDCPWDEKETQEPIGSGGDCSWADWYVGVWRENILDGVERVRESIQVNAYGGTQSKIDDAIMLTDVGTCEE